MPVPWKEWKTKPRFPTLPTVPWKSRKHREISTFPPPRLVPHGKLENQKAVSHFPTRYKRRRLRFPSLQNPNPKKGSRPLRGLLILPTFRIILYWNQDPVSGSFLDWKMLFICSSGDVGPGSSSRKFMNRKQLTALPGFRGSFSPPSPHKTPSPDPIHRASIPYRVRLTHVSGG